MLDETGIDGHLRLCRIYLGYCIRNSGPESDSVSCQSVPIFRKIKFERRIRHDKIELLQRTVRISVRWFKEGVALHNIGERSREVVKNQVKT